MLPSTKSITTPLTKDIVRSLQIGDHVLITGKLYTARDAAHKRMLEALEQGIELPVSLENQIIYYVGPSPARPGQIIGAAGPTTSGRMDSYVPALLQQGLTGMIGKGNRFQVVFEALKDFCAIYFATISGAGALLSKCITKYTVVAYHDLGSEALAVMDVKDFPAIVVGDAEGRNFYTEAPKKYIK